MKTFKDYFNFPLHADEFSGTYIWGSKGNMAAMFDWELDISQSQKEAIVEVINGNMNAGSVDVLKGRKFAYSGTKSDAVVYDGSGNPFIILRGWEYLTSPSFCKLKSSKAAEVQDEFGKYIETIFNSK